MSNDSEFDAVVIGAGAAGMMCAAVAGQRGRRVLLVEHYGKVGEKIRISGGGRCNFANLHAGPENYLSSNPDFCRSALARYGPREFIELIERHGIRYHEKTRGQLFCDQSATQVIAMLMKECDMGDVRWRMPAEVEAVRRVDGQFEIKAKGDMVRAGKLVIATGGLTVPKIGATPFGYQLATQFGLRVVLPRPALVPLTFEPMLLEQFGSLAGVSLAVAVRCGEGFFEESLLFTHRGLSGPAILQISSYWRAGETIEIDLLPRRDAVEWLTANRASRQRLDNLLATVIPMRLAERWCAIHDCAKPVHTLPTRQLVALGEALSRWRVRPAGTLGYTKAEVTLGGVDTRDLSSKTMEALAVPGLHFIGEVVDVTGQLGGFNFQWAWSSGHAAGAVL